MKSSLNALRLLAAASLCLSLNSWGQSDTAAVAQVKSGIESNTKGSVVPDSVRTTPIEGLFEVSTKGLDLFYVDRSGRYALIDGRMVDMRERKDLTIARLEELRRIDFTALPLHLAIKRVTGDGRNVMAVFEDPTCPLCLTLHKFLLQLPDTTIYHFPYPIASKDALPITATAWCSPNRAEVWGRAMQGGKVPPAAKPTCDISSVVQFVKLGEELKVVGTPTVFFSNGRRAQGLVPPDQFVAAMKEAETEAAQARPVASK